MNLQLSSPINHPLAVATPSFLENHTIAPESNRQQILTELDCLSFPFTNEEGRLRDIIDSLKSIVVVRPPSELLLEMGMRHQDCHENCAKFHLYHDSKSQIVTGWLARDDMYIHHSVIFDGGKFICITPGIENERFIYYVPDDKIRLNANHDGRMYPTREDIKVPFCVRRKPDEVISRAILVQERFRSGMDLSEAISLDMLEN